MEKYDYREAVKEDVKEWIEENLDSIPFDDFEDGYDFKEWLNDRLWDEDSVTGNASGSYWFSAYKAEEALNHNYDLLLEAVDGFCETKNILEKGAEWCDVTIRCYLLPDAISEAVDERYDRQ